MKKLTSRIYSTALAASLLLHALDSARAADTTPSAADKTLSELFPDTVVARGKGFEIKRSQIEDELMAYKASLAAQRQQFPEAQRALIESNMVNKLAVQAILTSRETPADKLAGQQKADNYLAMSRTNAASENVFAQEVKAATGGLSVDQYRARMAQQAAEEMVVDRELRSTLKVTDAEIAKFYNENTNASERPEMVRAAHILISTSEPGTRPPQPIPPLKKKEKEELAKKIRARAAAGEDFARLVKEFSDDPGSKNKGGEYTFPRGQMLPEFESAAFSMKTNEVSALVETVYGYHIIKLLEKIPAKRIPFDELSPRIKEYLLNQQLNSALPAYLERIKKEANTEYFGMSSTVKPAMPLGPAAPGK